MFARLAWPSLLVVPALLSALSPSSITLTTSTNPVVFGHPITLRAVVSPVTASGTVTFYDGVAPLETVPLTGGAASLTTTLLPSGAPSLKARYNGSSAYSGSSSAVLVETVNTVPGNGFQTTYPEGFDVFAVAGDFDGDGKQDLALGFYRASSVGVMLGNGDGTFEPMVMYTVDSTPGAIAVGDFNGDGKPDLAVSLQTGLAILTGNGDGTFQAAVALPEGNTPNALATGDFNGDGNADLAYGNLDGVGGIGVILGHGDGTFATAVNSLPLDGSPVAPAAVGDFNGDGIADLATSLVSVLLGNGDGTFRQAGFCSGAGGATGLALGDFNGDGKLDLAVSRSAPADTVTVCLGDGAGNLTPLGVVPAGIAGGALAVGDFNGDGKADLAVVDQADTAGNAFLTTVLLGNGDGTFQLPVGYAAGTFSASVAVGDFNGDGRADLAVGGTGSLAVLIALGLPTSTAVASSANPSTFGQNVTLTATVAPSTATGIVTFSDGATELGTATLSAGMASLSLTTLSVGTHSLTAAYGGDTNDASSSSPILTQTVSPIPTSTGLASSSNPSSFGQNVVFTATVVPATASGLVTFYHGSTVLGTSGLSGGAAELAIATLPVGGHSLTASYAGSTDTAGSASPTLTQTVRAAASSTTLTSSPNPSTFHQSVKLTANVGPATATGTVTFFNGSTSLGTGVLSGGVATLSTASLTIGTRTLTAVYGGDADDLPSTSAPLNQGVRTTTSTALTASPNPASAGQSVVLTAVVTPTKATGTITFYHGAVVMGTAALTNGMATFSTATLAAGAHPLTAGYGGNATDGPSESPVVNLFVK